jgi:hypothetical protein
MGGFVVIRKWSVCMKMERIGEEKNEKCEIVSMIFVL